ncbi:hypothetical protein BDN67DRAFT_619639 [Paxillus ammoniavirescens]|nr:hypothetical protein BDN67DRAFT_619639 [Paxillus ammoniavirescens]
MSHVSQTPLNPSPPLLRVNTESLSQPHASGHSWHVQTPTYIPSPTFNIPLTPGGERSSPSAHLAKVAVTHNANHARDESRKLLGLLLEQLRSRPKPPPIYESFSFQTNDTRQPRLGQILGIVKNTVTSNPLAPNLHILTKDEGDDEADDADVFSTDATLELIFQLKEVLFFSVSQGWQIFGTGYDANKSSSGSAEVFSLAVPVLKSTI